MRKRFWILLSFVSVQCCLAFTTLEVEEKAESTIPVTTFSPPEGNTTFLGGTTWCVARPGVSQFDLQTALDWACGIGQADCRPIQADGPCFHPDTLMSHASYAFNSYYQQNGNSDIACHFGGTASLTQSDPSYEKCVYATSGSIKSSASPSSKCTSNNMWRKIGLVLLLLYLRR